MPFIQEMLGLNLAYAIYSGDARFESCLCHLVAILTEVLCDFSQSFQANAMVEGKLYDEDRPLISVQYGG